MPFAMNCPECSASLKIPDELEGKKIKCKSCGTPFRAQQEEEDEPPARKKKPAAKAKPPRDEDDEERPSKARRLKSEEDDEEDERRSRRSSRDERSAKSKKSAGKKKGPPVLLLGLLGSGFVVLVGVGVLIYFLARGGGGGGLLGGSASESLPPGWEEINEKEGGFRVYMPGRPIRQQAPGRIPANARNAFRWASVTGDGVYSFQVGVVDLGDRSISTDPASLKATLKQVEPSAFFFEKIAVEREVKVGGKPGIEMELVNENPDFTDSTVMRLTASGGKFYVITLTYHDRGKKDEKVRQTFFDSFRLQ